MWWDLTYECAAIDIYDTKNFNEFVYALGKGILTALKPIPS